jgi:hypothetical protein
MAAVVVGQALLVVLQQGQALEVGFQGQAATGCKTP